MVIVPKLVFLICFIILCRWWILFNLPHKCKLFTSNGNKTRLFWISFVPLSLILIVLYGTITHVMLGIVMYVRTQQICLKSQRWFNEDQSTRPQVIHHEVYDTDLTMVNALCHILSRFVPLYLCAVKISMFGDDPPAAVHEHRSCFDRKAFWVHSRSSRSGRWVNSPQCTVNAVARNRNAWSLRERADKIVNFWSLSNGILFCPHFFDIFWRT